MSIKYCPHKGAVMMYFVNRLKPEISLDEKVFVANEKFWDSYLSRGQK
jgi:hypothetical protein